MCLGKELLLVPVADGGECLIQLLERVWGWFLFSSLHRGNFHLSTAESSVAARGELTQPPVPVC